VILTGELRLPRPPAFLRKQDGGLAMTTMQITCYRVLTEKAWIPAFGLVAKVQKERFEIAARFFKSLAMT